ncbi:dihydrodipicolinate synthase family protein [Saccharopolyspora rhizosphaerae]|uniref:Dihydrodipicolinate synthase family protein n=1 Tax=Saccharopolyspora rhizosphaerae TaxID=2492662 RepID=A0A426JSY7_9PSEU|nr:dihydrodipicolinate synthase family protein [Saccharopolyspora rhizosphaerae]RRO16256.1 dihydrodipicolinate synthase family protein [Saccharopolyspora rhizosphaerae]
MPTSVEALHGVTAITVTPFDGTVAPDWPGYEAVVARMAEAGVQVITPNGNTSEFYALSRDEWQRANEVTAAAAGGSVVMPGIGYDIATAQDMAVAVQQLGASLAMLHQPVHPHQSVAGWVAYNRQIAQSAPGLAFVLYVKDPRVGADALGALFDACPNVVGVKYAVADPPRFGELCATLGEDRVAWSCGLAERWAPAFWPLGAAGFTSGGVNVAPKLSLDYLAALRAGDQARVQRLWSLIAPFEEMRAADATACNVAVVKEALAQQGLCGAGVRPPAGVLSPQQREQVTGILASWSEAGY